MYKIFAKVLVAFLKKWLSNVLLPTLFGLLEAQQIHDAIGVAQEGLHSMKSKKLTPRLAKLDLSKAYDKLCWLDLILLLIQIIFSLKIVNWIMGYVSLVSFIVLVNSVASPFCIPTSGI